MKKLTRSERDEILAARIQDSNNLASAICKLPSPVWKAIRATNIDFKTLFSATDEQAKRLVKDAQPSVYKSLHQDDNRQIIIDWIDAGR